MGRTLLSTKFPDLFPFLLHQGSHDHGFCPSVYGLAHYSVASKHHLFPPQEFWETESSFAHLHLTDEPAEVQKVKIELPKLKTPSQLPQDTIVPTVLPTCFLFPIFPSLFGKISQVIPLICFHEKNVMHNISSEYVTHINLKTSPVFFRKHFYSLKVILQILL